MPDQLKDKRGTSGGSTTGIVDTGAIFGLNEETANYPVYLDHGTKGTPGTPGHLSTSGFGRHPGMVGGTPGAPGKKPMMTTVRIGVSYFYHLPANEQDAYTMAMANAGYLTMPKKGRPKAQAIHAAWRDVVLTAAREGKTWDEVLDEGSGALGGPGGDGSGGGAGNIAQLSDPAELRLTVDQAAQKVLGRNATDDEKRLFIHLEHSKEQGYADSLNAGATTVTTPSTQAQALEFAQRADPVRADSRKVLDTFGVIAKMFGGQG